MTSSWRAPTHLPHQQPLWSHPLPHPTTNRMAVLMHKQASRWLDALDVTKLITMEIYCCTLSITPSLPIHPLTATETEPGSALTSRKLTVRLTLFFLQHTITKINRPFTKLKQTINEHRNTFNLKFSDNLKLLFCGLQCFDTVL